MRPIEDKYKEFVEAVFSQAEKYTRGSVMPWSTIEAAMARGRDNEGGRQIIKRLRARILREREIVTIAIAGVGLQFLHDTEAADIVPVMRQRRAYRQLNRGLRELGAVRHTALSDAQRLAVVRQRQCMSEERRTIGRAYREMTQNGKKQRTQTNPIRKVG